MLRTVLIDDERSSLETLRLEITEHCPELDIVAIAQGAEEGIEAITGFHPHLVFLDIQMPGKNGFELLRSLPKVDFEVIFSTAYDEYSLQAIKVSALDYLLKPVDPDELKRAVLRAKEAVDMRRSKERVEFLLTGLTGGSSSFEKIALPTLNGLDFMDVNDILYCKADGNYTTIHSNNGETMIISRTLSEFEEMLNRPLFFRTHKSSLVNLRHIKHYIKGSGGQVILSDGTSIQVARSRKAALMELIYNG